MATTAEIKVITPAKIVIQEPVISVTAPSVEGELTVLPRHEHFFTLLKEGIVTIRREGKEDELLAIGGGYLETDGKQITVLVSEAYGQDDIDEAQAQKALEDAKKLIANTKDHQEREQAYAAMRRSEIGLSLLSKRRKRPQRMAEQ